MEDLHFENAHNEALDFHFNEKNQQITITIEGFCTQVFTTEPKHRKRIIDWLTPLFMKYDSRLSIILNTKYIDSQVFKIFKEIMEKEVMENKEEKGKIIIKLKKANLVYKNMFARSFEELGAEICIE